MVSPKMGEPQYRPQYTLIRTLGTSKKAPLILGNTHLGLESGAWNVKFVACRVAHLAFRGFGVWGLGYITQRYRRAAWGV